MVFKRKTYSGELDHIDPFEFGAQLHRDGKSTQDNDPTDEFYGGNDDDPVWDFLNTFWENMNTGWRREDNRVRKERFLAQLPDFQANIPEVGEVVFVERPNSQGKYTKCRIEYVPPEKDAVLIRNLEEGAARAYGQSPISLVAYENPGRFPRFYKEIPAGQTGERGES